jgi:hypothetical protein
VEQRAVPLQMIDAFAPEERGRWWLTFHLDSTWRAKNGYSDLAGLNIGKISSKSSTSCKKY